MCACGKLEGVGFCGGPGCEFPTATAAATATQPTPKGQGRAITPLVIADLEARSAAGAKKYGEPLKAFNGRDALTDAYQEVLDLAQYVRQEMVERASRAEALRQALNFALANVESAAAGKLTGDLGRAASFIGDALRILESEPTGGA